MVERGETIEITDRGRPVALLVPLPDGSPMERLRRAGELEPASADFDDLPEPLPSSAARLPSEVLAGLRHAER
jgi:antitoxin (DNA-binding transcriptional repressor) of toxin-antitoxin stability system